MFSQDKCEESTNHYINLGFLIQRRLGLYHRCFIVIDCLQLTAEKLHPNFLLRRKKTVVENLMNKKKIVRWVRKLLSDHWWDRLCGSTTTAAKCEEWKLYLKRLDDNLWHPVVFYSPTETQHLVKLRHLTLRKVYDSDAVLGHPSTRPPAWLRGSAALQQTNTSSASALFTQLLICVPLPSSLIRQLSRTRDATSLRVRHPTQSCQESKVVARDRAGVPICVIRLK